MALFIKKNKEMYSDEPQWSNAKSQSEPILQLEDKSDIQNQLKLIHFTEEELRSLIVIRPYMEKHIEEIVDTFYNTITAIPHLKKIIEDH
ncbi:MAG: hypothetical protein GX072_09445, partial [Lysinibacillus sp.]|nr:hypothetical protein [Lysinibacillus sp.]